MSSSIYLGTWLCMCAHAHAHPTFLSLSVSLSLCLFFFLALGLGPTNERTNERTLSITWVLIDKQRGCVRLFFSRATDGNSTLGNSDNVRGHGEGMMMEAFETIVSIICRIMIT